MRHSTLRCLLGLVVAAGFGPGSHGDEPRGLQLRAAQWHNLHTLELEAGPRTCLLYLFSTRFAADPPVDLIATLNRLDQRPDVVVFGLSPDGAERVAKYIDQKRICFAVGSGAQKLRGFGVTAWPAVFSVRVECARPSESPTRLDATVAALRKFERALADARNKMHSTSAPVPTEAPTDAAQKEIAALKETALTDDDEERRSTAINRLRELLEPKAFVAFCDELLAAPPPARADTFWMKRAFWYGNIAHAQHMADPGIADKQSRTTPLTEAQFLAPDAIDSAAAEAFAKKLPGKSYRQIRDMYLEHISTSSIDLLIRSEIMSFAYEAGWSCEQYKQLADEVLAYEPDASLRWELLAGIGNTCLPGDPEAIEIAQRAYDTDANIATGRAIAQELLYYLTTGDAGTEPPERYRNKLNESKRKPATADK